MKRLTMLVLALALALASGCSKTADVATPTGVDANKISNDAAKCAEMATSWASLLTPVALPTFGDADKAKVQKGIDDLKAKVPDSVKKDVDTIGNGIKNAKTQTDAAKFMSTPEFTAANTNVTKYVTADCSKIGG